MLSSGEVRQKKTHARSGKFTLYGIKRSTCASQDPSVSNVMVIMTIGARYRCLEDKIFGD